MHKLLTIAAILVTGAVACTNKSDNGGSHDASQPANDYFKTYDPSSLIEVRNFADLPDGVKTQAGMDAKGEGPEGRLREFMVGGASQTSALVAYEQFGYTPTYTAAAYVYTGSKWIPVRSWEIGKASTLKEVLSIIALSK
jgi:hypothetical protein